MQCCLLPAHATSAIAIAIVRCAPRHRWFVCVFAVYLRICRYYLYSQYIQNTHSRNHSDKSEISAVSHDPDTPCCVNKRAPRHRAVAAHAPPGPPQ